ncbi:hypothetical protein HYQ46_013458 [Verticillium longisporum]|nr:hypothetical protein HYQ46_013458 [Verticillium longisporum]
MTEVSSTRLYLGNLPRNDFARQSSLDVVYSETGRDGNGRGDSQKGYPGVGAVVASQY